jgi:hypothetical protein
MRELLIRYLLGELSESEERELERRLAENPHLRCELDQLRICFATACEADDTAGEPPRGLAERTIDRVAECEDDRLESVAVACANATDDPSAGMLGWTLADLTVAGGVVLAVSMLLFPALDDSRNLTRRNICQNNQRQMWLLFANYAENNHGFYPKVRPNDNAGAFAVKLAERDYVARDELAVLLVCPGAPLADAIRAGHFVIRIPSAAELESMSPAALAQAKRNMSPFYAYRLPYRIGEQYHYVRDERLPLTPVFADTAGPEHAGLMSPNHGGTILQVTSQDGSVRVLQTATVPGRSDALFLNAIGLQAAGVGRHDVVLGRSEVTPAFTFPQK